MCRLTSRLVYGSDRVRATSRSVVIWFSDSSTYREAGCLRDFQLQRSNLLESLKMTFPTALVGCCVSRVIVGVVASRVAGDCCDESADWQMVRTAGGREERC